MPKYTRSITFTVSADDYQTALLSHAAILARFIPDNYVGNSMLESVAAVGAVSLVTELQPKEYEAGEYVSERYGHYASAEVCRLAIREGMPTDDLISWLLASYDESGHSENYPSEYLYDLATDSERWLNDNRPKELHSWRFDDGSFGLYPDDCERCDGSGQEPSQRYYWIASCRRCQGSGSEPANPPMLEEDYRQLSSERGLTRSEGIAYLSLDNGATFSKYGSTGAECAPVAFALAEILSNVNGETISTDDLDAAMSRVVNDDDNVTQDLAEHRNFLCQESSDAIADIVGSQVLATITVYERECDADDYDTESGQGMPESVEPYETDSVEIDRDDMEVYGSLDAAIVAALADAGCSQWDGSNVAYDPDGSSMAADGTVTERYATVEHHTDESAS